MVPLDREKEQGLKQAAIKRTTRLRLVSMNPIRMAIHQPPGTKEPGLKRGVIKKTIRKPNAPTKLIRAAENREEKI